MNELTLRGNGNLPSKAEVGSYIHDALEMEIDLYTLQRSRDELKRLIDKEKKEDPTAGIHKPTPTAKVVPKEKASQKPLVKGNEDERRQYIRTFRSNNRSRYFKGGLFTFLLLLIIGIGLTIIVTGSLRSGGNSNDMSSVLIAFLGVAVIAIGIPVLVKIKKGRNRSLDEEAEYGYALQIKRQNEQIEEENRKEKERARRQYERECEEAAIENERLKKLDEEKLAKYRQRCENARKDHNAFIAALEDQLEKLDDALIKASLQRDKFYVANIIPVDYRTIPVIFYLDHSFRNDLVDTVRQGIDRYELSEYRSAVLSGLNDIASRLNNLSGLMLDLGKRIDNINVQVSMMSNDIYKMADRQAQMETEMNDSNRRVLEESRLQRYATESLNRNAEKIVRYYETGSTY